MFYQDLIRAWPSLFRRAQQRLRISVLIDMLPLGLVMTDRNDETILTNQALSRLLAYDSKFTLVEQLEKIVHLKKLARSCRQDPKTCQPQEVQVEHRWLRFVITPVLARQIAIGTIVLVEDVTDHKEWERTREEFFAVASHELRTPLTAIRGNLSLIQEHYQPAFKSNPELKQMIDDMYQASLRLINIVNDFLDASKLEQGRVNFDYRPVSLNHLLNNVITDCSVLIMDKHLKLTLDDSLTGQLNVLADKSRLYQVATNLISNALKHTDQGSITITLSRLKQQARVDVSDTGSGIPIGQRHLLFRKFQQTKSRLLTLDRTQGTGMGLYISKLLVEAMGGRIWLERSQPGQGSTFSFTMPMVK